MSDELSLDLFEQAGARPGRPASDAGRPADGPSDAAQNTPEEPRVWTVSQVNRAVRRLLEDTVEPLWISGEIGGWTPARSGHRYFTLRDERAQLRCVMWKQEVQRLPVEPEEGMRVRVYGTLTLYEARGSYQLSVERLEAEGEEGLWRLAFEKLRLKLEAEGLLARERKRPLPRFPGCVGVVTSPTGAAIRDILSVLRRRAPWIRVVLSGARVQGEGAAEEVAHAVEALAATGLADVIIVGRGGGSVEDLWAFNEEILARTIARCPVPVVSAVGHEVDVTIADLVADLRAPTPSAAAEAVAPDRTAVGEQLSVVPARLASGLRGAVARRRVWVSDALRGLVRGVERRLIPVRQTLDLGVERLERATRRTLERRRERLARLTGKLEALSPLATLERGYAVPRTPDGVILRCSADLPSGTTFHLRVVDGEVACESKGPIRSEKP